MRAGFELTVHNRSSGPTKAFVGAHRATPAADPAALAEASDVVITMLSDDVALRERKAARKAMVAQRKS